MAIMVIGKSEQADDGSFLNNSISERLFDEMYENGESLVGIDLFSIEDLDDDGDIICSDGMPFFD